MTKRQCIDTLIVRDLAGAILHDLEQCGIARISGPPDAAGRILAAIEEAGTVLGQEVAWVRDGGQWIAAVS